ncbi:MAG TPA: adenine nucleotide alpha hydrolase family protein, partial [candidate division WOR-3 bacterium]|nr:adenine nucleotide alpha hydrolase family protein [candidate division WOR-3 bacterium]
ALDKFRLIESGETAVVGVSGGPDSLCLLHALKDRNERRRLGWRLVPVHVNPGFPGWRPERVVRACRRLGFDCRVITLDVPKKLAATGKDACFFCARARRRALFETAAELGARKVTLGHHLEDVNETYLLNLMRTSSAAAFLPRQELFGGEVVIVRPLYYLEKPMIADYLRKHGIGSARNRCPYERGGARRQLRRFLERLYREDRRVRTNIFWGIHNLKPQYLPRPVATRGPARPLAGGDGDGEALGDDSRPG